MAGNLSDYAEKKLLDHLLGTASYTMPSAVYLALYTVAPTDSTEGTEVTGGDYERKVVTFNGVTSGSGSTTNNTTLDFTGMPACTVVAVAVLDALTSGNILVYGTLSTNKTLDSGDILRVASGDLSITIA
jgi:hypothetical protein